MANTIATTITAQSLIAQYNRGPISSIFSPPSSCLSTFTSVAGSGALYFGHNGERYWDPSCYPTATATPSVASPEALWDLYYYSPAVSCPIGWAIAGTAKNTFGGVDSTYLTIGLETTAVLCCPSGFTSKDFNHQCGSSFPAGQNTISYRAPVLKNGNWDIPRDLSTVYRTITGTGDWTVFGDGIPIWFQSSDKVAFTASKTSSTTSPTSTSVISSLTTTSLPTTSPLVPVPENSTDSAQASSRLSTGAKAGIGIGVALGVLGLVAIVAFFLYKRRQRATYNDVKRRELPGHDPKSYPVHDPESYRGTIHSELSGQDQQVVHELPDGAGNQRLMENYKYPRT